MYVLLAIYLLGVLATLCLFERCKWYYAILWPISLVFLTITSLFAALSSSEERFKIENM